MRRSESVDGGKRRDGEHDVVVLWNDDDFVRGTTRIIGPVF